ncbi:hypothetical protein DFH28DRAFT_1136546 [Melampsora americana]|nr:hypothetical protein DFH28DRAFT_1136546 [Melampsora americana]
MAGQAGRDKQPAVAILLVRPLTPGEENLISDLNPPEDQDDNQWMHAMCITDVCLQVSFSILLRVGYIPLTKSSSTVLAKTQRKKDAGMATCLCSNCSPKAAHFFLAQLPALSKLNFTRLNQADQPGRPFTWQPATDLTAAQNRRTFGEAI